MTNEDCPDWDMRLTASVARIEQILTHGGYYDDVMALRRIRERAQVHTERWHRDHRGRN